MSIRLFPSKKQEQKFQELSLIKDEVYNHFLGVQQKAYEEKRKLYSLYEMHKMATSLKKDEKYELYPLEVNYCPKCHNCQLSVAIDSKKVIPLELLLFELK